MYIDPYQVGRKYKVIAEVQGARIFRHFLHIVMNRLMEGDRMVIDKELSMMIALVKKNPKRVGKFRNKHKIYWTNPGKTHEVILHGIKHKYYFRIPGRRRRELRERVQNRQQYFDLSETH